MSYPAEITKWFQSAFATDFKNTCTASWTPGSWKNYEPLFVQLFNRTLTTVADLSIEFLATKVLARESHYSHTRDQQCHLRTSQELAQHLIFERFNTDFEYQSVASLFLTAFFQAGYLALLVSRLEDTWAQNPGNHRKHGLESSTGEMNRRLPRQPNNLRHVLAQPPVGSGRFESTLSMSTPPHSSLFGLGVGEGRGYTNDHKTLPPYKCQYSPHIQYADAEYTSPEASLGFPPLDTDATEEGHYFEAPPSQTALFEFPLCDRILMVHFPAIDQRDFSVPVCVAALVDGEALSPEAYDLRYELVRQYQQSCSIEEFVHHVGEDLGRNPHRSDGLSVLY
ncbi:hypothetical protein HYALB_00002205 [Hymenoscyphus albidus]|uniref:Uncharacterized protein n=1 Tax=Hymenoscyphus albidus TaxID=595503 RepID=A0A9N9LEB7_9HELO|nr:hypothetical protein HYALB_00002205 [Hymenoscyphus albidus]